MQVSIIIVSYNVKYFINQCIASILESDFDGEFEIIIVDNASSDGSVDFIRSKYPSVHVVANDENVGFSKANNQGVAISKGNHVLILNPDTILSKNTLQVCKDFIASHEDSGIVGVRMYDGSGTYLPESKRGFPTPFVSFCKIFGLSHLFPKSRAFNQYYLGYLSEDENQKVDILTGAFMFMMKATYIHAGGFDEDYCMYGEDIDLSYRVQKSGLTNYYVQDSSIIHYKGESTRKMSFDYVRRFYEAMIIFAKKHNSGARVAAYTFAIMSAIYLNAFFTFLGRMKKALLKPLVDAVVLGSSFYFVKYLWEQYYFNVDNYFSNTAVIKNGIIYVFLCIGVYLLLGKYHRSFKSWRWVKILTAAILTLLVIYSLLPSDLRFSRAVLVLGASLASVLLFIADKLMAKFKTDHDEIQRRTAVVGDPNKSDRLLALLDKRKQSQLVGFIGHNAAGKHQDNFIGEVDAVESIVRFHNVDEVIFDQREINATEIMKVMTTLGHGYQYKIYTSDTGSVVGSYSKEFQGQIDTFEIEYSISSEYHRFIKRLMDVLLAVMLFITFPVFWTLNGFNIKYFENIISVIAGRHTWVGYLNTNQDMDILPHIKTSVLEFQEEQRSNHLNPNQKMQLNFIYAREYNVGIDIRAFFNQINRLGQ